MKQGCRGGLVDPTAPKARFPVWVVSQAANILDPIFVRGIEFHLHALLGDAFTASRLLKFLVDICDDASGVAA